MPAKLASVLNNAEGFPPGIVQQGIENKTEAATQAHNAATAIYNAAINSPNKTPITNASWTGGAFLPGVYELNGTGMINSNLVLNGNRNPDAVFIFIIKGDLTIADNAKMTLEQDAKVSNVVWVLQNRLIVGSGAALRGNFIAQENVSIGGSTEIRGRIASLQGEVSIINSRFYLPTDRAITITRSPGNAGTTSYFIGETITYKITVKNNGPVDDTNVRVTNLLFTGSDRVFTPDNGITNLPEGGFQWNIGGLKVGESVTLTITAVLRDAGEGFVRGSVSGTAADEITDNNSMDLRFCVILPDAGEIKGPMEICVGDEVEYYINEITGVTKYEWSLPRGWEIIGERFGNRIKVKAVERNADPFISVTVSSGCDPSPPSTLRVNNYPDPPQTPGPIKPDEGLCKGESASYSIDPVENATNYIWSVPEDWEITGGQGTVRITVKVGEASGKVSVIAENICGKSGARSLDVKPFLDVPNQPVALSGGGSITICVTTNEVSFSVKASADVAQYVWSQFPAEWEILSGQGTNTITFNPNGKAGEITVSGINSCGSSSLKFEVIVIPDQPIVPGDIFGSFPVCKGSVGTKYWVNEVPFATEYNWAVPNGWRITAGQGTREITVDLDPDAQSGDISVLVINACGKEGRSKKNVEATTAKPVTPAAITGDAFTCITSETYYSTKPVDGAQYYDWEVPEGWQILEGQGTVRIKVKFGTKEGDIKVSAKNSCGISEPAVLRVKPFSPIPNIPFVITGPDKGVCVNQTKVVFQLDPVDQAQRYTWSFPTGWRIVEGQGTNRIMVDVGTQSGTIRVTAENPCGESQAASLAISLQPDIPAPKPGPINGQTQYCAGKNQTYSIIPVNGAVSYQWTFPGPDWEVVGDRNGTSITVRAGTTQGQVKVAAINNCGSVGESSTLALQLVGEVPPAPSAIITDRESYCGNTANLVFSIAAVPTATRYIWTVPNGWTITDGENTRQIKVTAGTSGGEVTVVAVNSCGESQSVKLLTEPQRPLMNPEAIQGTLVPCDGKTNAVYSIPAISGADTYLWTLPAGWELVEGEGTNKITVKVKGGGTITVKARNSCGTTAESKLDVKVVTAPPLTPVSIIGKAIACATRTTTYAVAEVANAAFYNWVVPTGWTIISGQGSREITVQVGINSGEVKVEAENDCGKSAAATAVVATSPLPVISRIIDKTTACSDLAVYELESNSMGSTFTWSVPAGWEIISGQGTSTISVMQGAAKGEITVVADNGLCQSEPVTLLSDPSLRDAALTIPNVFTPNNDGNNDTWTIGSLLNYPDNDLVVVNRWGNEVFRRKGYKNDWNGDKLAEGTYYYVLRMTLCDGTEKTYKGYVMIVR
ncbi:ice-binding family protein [Pontibacter aquaedesilientis]|nr:ice-binding family protein [Pontibacter aquaedesilientis]